MFHVLQCLYLPNYRSLILRRLDRCDNYLHIEKGRMDKEGLAHDSQRDNIIILI